VIIGATKNSIPRIAIGQRKVRTTSSQWRREAAAHHTREFSESAPGLYAGVGPEIGSALRFTCIRKLGPPAVPVLPQVAHAVSCSNRMARPCVCRRFWQRSGDSTTGGGARPIAREKPACSKRGDHSKGKAWLPCELSSSRSHAGPQAAGVEGRGFLHPEFARVRGRNRHQCE